ncbi:perilipin 6 [Polymixia lowei]
MGLRRKEMSHMNHQNVEASAVQRVSRLPLVRSVLQSFRSVYSDIKDHYPLLYVVGGVAEIGVRNISLAALRQATPLLQSLEPQIAVANGYACVGLDRLERSFPVLHQSTEQVVAHLKDGFLVTLDDVQMFVVDRVDGGLDWLERLSEALLVIFRTLQESQVGMATSSGLDNTLHLLEDATAYYLPLPPTLRREWEMRVQVYEDEDEDDEPGLWTRFRVLLLSVSLQLYHRILKLTQRVYQAAGTLRDMVGLGQLLEVVGFLLPYLELLPVTLAYRMAGLRELALAQVRGQAALLAEQSPVRQVLGLPSQVHKVLRELQELTKILLQLLVNSTLLYNMLQQPSDQEVEDFLNQEDFLSVNASCRSSTNSLFLKAMDGRPRRRKSLYSRARKGSGSANNPQGPGLAPADATEGRRGSLKQEGPAPESASLALTSDNSLHRRASATELLLRPLMQFVSQSQKAVEYLSPGPTAGDEAAGSLTEN